MIPLAEAQDFVVGAVRALPPERVVLRAASRLVLADDVVSDAVVPPFANTAMDGFAVRAADVAAASESAPVELRVVATLAAGAGPAIGVGAGEAIRIMTGAVIPDGCDAVVPVEHTDRSLGSTADVVRVQRSATVGDNIRPAGEDVTAGQTLFVAGTVLTPAHLGLLASIGRVEVPVHRRPRVGVLSTGDELVPAPAPLRPGQIRDSNRAALIALVERVGAEAVDLGIARDTEEAIDAAVRDGIGCCDALVTTGGVSMGDFDYVKVVLDRLSAAGGQPMRWMQVAIKPAKPLAFGLIDGRPVFGLPGNPTSSMVSFELFARPALRRMMGYPPTAWHRRRIRGAAGAELRRADDAKTVFTRVHATFDPHGRLVVTTSGAQGSNLLGAMAAANALAVLPPGPSIPAGEAVDVLLLDPDLL